MSENAVEKTIEITEPVKVEKVLPTRGELKEQGWSAEEMDIAKKHKMVREDGPESNGTAPEKPEELNKKEPVEKPVEEVKPEEKPESKRNVLPDFSMSPEQEAVFLKTFPAGTPQNGTYLRMKSERKMRQAAEARAKELEAKIQAIESKMNQRPEVEVDENGNPVDPDNVPMTPKMFREMQKREMEARTEEEKKMNERALRVSEAIKDQEDYAKSVHPDYEETMKLAKEVITNFDKLGLDKWKQDKVRRLYDELRDSAQRADEMEIDGYTTALIGYEIGTFHPNYKPSAVTNGLSSETDGNSPTKANGSHTPETMKRIEANTQRRASSASIPGGGGKRTVSPSEVSVVEFNRFDAKQRLSFREKHPEEYDRIMRG